MTVDLVLVELVTVVSSVGVNEERVRNVYTTTLTAFLSPTLRQVETGKD